MEKKNNSGLVAIIIILIIALLGVCFYVAYDKGLIFNNEVESTEKEKEAEEESNGETEKLETENSSNETINNKLENNESQSTDNNISYYTDGTYYYLVLYPEVTFSQVDGAKGVSDVKHNSFYIGVNGKYFFDGLYGRYEISDGKLTLRFIGSAYSYNLINNTLNHFNNVKVETLSDSSYYVTLDYSEDKIIFGNVELLKK